MGADENCRSGFVGGSFFTTAVEVEGTIDVLRMRPKKMKRDQRILRQTFSFVDVLVI